MKSTDISILVSAVLVVTITPAVVDAQSNFDAPLTPEPAAAATVGPPNQDGALKSLLVDVGHDYKNFFSIETAWWLGAGGAAAGIVHTGDQAAADWAQRKNLSLPVAEWYGSQYTQLPLAIGWWVTGALAGSDSQASVGRDLLRGQIQAITWTYGAKVVVNRTRPNGESHSFPSGHASASFTTAMVLQEHFGWKVGLPAFALAAYTGFQRVAANQHWTSDVVFGAALGMAGARTVTIHVRKTRVSVAPVSLPGGGGAAIVTVER